MKTEKEIEKKVIDLYIDDLKGSTTIAKELNLHRSLVYNILKRNNVIRTRSEAAKLHPGNPWTPESRLKMSDSMKKAIAENRHPGWNSVNSKVEMSYPEKTFFEHLKCSDFLKEYTLKSHHRVSKYTLDFIIVELKIDIELDGAQHFTNQSVKEKDVVRDKYMIDNEWKIFRVSWKTYKKDRASIMSELKQFIESSEEDCVKFYSEEDCVVKSKLKHGSRQKYTEHIHNCRTKLNNKRLQLLLDSDIDTTKNGWKKKLSALFGIQHQKISQWLKTYRPDLL